MLGRQMNSQPPPFDGESGLASADIIEVAAQLFIESFTSAADVRVTACSITDLYADLGALAGIRHKSTILRQDSGPDVIAMLTLDSVLLWEHAHFAARATGEGKRMEVVLLRDGYAVLSDPAQIPDLLYRVRPPW